MISYRIDNPGGGDCGYYSFSIGLVDIMQKQLEESGHSTVLETWNGFDESVTSEDINSIDLYNNITNKHNSKDVLDKLQKSLRNIVYSYKCNALDDEDKLEETCPYLEFAYMLGPDFKKEFVDVDPEKHKKALEDRRAERYKEIEQSEVIQQASKKLNIKDQEGADKFLLAVFQQAGANLENYKEQLQDLPNILGIVENIISKDFAEYKSTLETIEINETEVAFIKEGEAKDFLKSDESIMFLQRNIADQEVIKGYMIDNKESIKKEYERILRPGYWAKHEDLSILASEFNVNLKLGNNGEMIDCIPSVELINIRNAHWITKVMFSAKKILDKIGLDFGSSGHAIICADAYEYCASKNLFSKYDKDNLDSVEKINSAVSNKVESDEDFAARLQVAEFKLVGIRG